MGDTHTQGMCTHACKYKRYTYVHMYVCMYKYIHMYIQREKESKFGKMLTTGELGEGYISVHYTKQLFCKFEILQNKVWKETKANPKSGKTKQPKTSI